MQTTITSYSSTREQLIKTIQQNLNIQVTQFNTFSHNPIIQLVTEGKMSSYELSNYLERICDQERHVLTIEDIDQTAQIATLDEIQQWHSFLEKKDHYLLYMVDPTDDEAFNYFQLKIAEPLHTRLINYQDWQIVFHHLSASHASTKTTTQESPTVFASKPDQVNQRLFHILKYAISTKASDIHLDPHSHMYQIRFRIDGLLHTTQHLSFDDIIPIITRVKSLSQLDISERRRPQDGSMNITIDEKQYAYRISTCPTVFGEKLVIRILKKEDSYSLEQLGYSDHQLQLLLKAINKPQGLILVCGPTGSGKTTTLYSALKHRLDPAVNLMSIEDPVEMKIEGINQVQVNSKIDLDFHNVLRSMLRQDPDIIMIGEIRDFETADIAIKAAQTGHLVFSSLHTQSALKCFSRLLAMGIREHDLYESLNLIISQRLVRKLCPCCKNILTADLFDIEMQKLFNDHSIYTAHGCINCQNGYSGRFAVYEMLSLMSDQPAQTTDMQQIAINLQEDNIEQQAINAVLNGLTTYNEIKRVIL